MPPKNGRNGGGKPGDSRDSEELPPLPQISESVPLPTKQMASMNIDEKKDDSSKPDGVRADNFSIELSPLWSGSNKGWQLTWGIWHRLPREEQKKIALEHGLKSIGEFEEFVSLQQAVDDSEYSMVETEVAPRGPSSAAVSLPSKSPTPPLDADPSKKLKDVEDDDDDSDDGNDHALVESQNPELNADMTMEELLLIGGRILLLPSEILHQIFAWLPVDAYGTMAMVSPHWKFITRTEAVYKRLCERLYLNQSKRRQLHVSRFGGSYRRMLETRPRVRAAGGCYVLKYSKIKKVERDMWCEIPIGAILETVYYRYLYFHEDGRCLYALSNSPPKVMFRRILNVILRKELNDPSIVSGFFQVQKYNCTVIAKQKWQTVKFEISIVPDSIHGPFSELTIDRHLTSVSGSVDEWSYDLVEHKVVPDKRFRFMKDPRL
jgi:F-box protein 9